MQMPGVVEMQESKFGELTAVTTPAVFGQLQSFYMAATKNISSLVMMRGRNIGRLMEILTFYHPLLCQQDVRAVCNFNRLPVL